MVTEQWRLPNCALCAALPPESFAQSIERSGVSAAALGSGYTVFFIYSALVGVFAVVLALVVATRRAKASDGPGGEDGS